MIHYAKQRLQAAGCAIVTASHNSAEINGLKWLVGEAPPGADEVQRLRNQSERPEATASAGRGPCSPLDISFDYVAWLQEMWIEALGRSSTWCWIRCTAAGRRGRGGT